MNANPQAAPNAGSMPNSAAGIDIPKVDFSGVTNGINSIKSNLNEAVSDFSSKSMVDASNEFLESNTIVAKFAFLIIVVIVFIMLFKIGVMALNYFMNPAPSPFIISGMINGSEDKTIEQDPKTDNPLIQPSENQDGGLEFTYSVWLNVRSLNPSGCSLTSAEYDPTNGSDGSLNHVFTKGKYDPCTKNGAPSLYLKSGANNTLEAVIFMDTMEGDGSLSNGYKKSTVVIKELPFKKWFHMAIRVQNRMLDVYVNGILTQRKDMVYIPRQNYAPMHICKNGGFSGNLSDLRYFASSLNVFQIYQIVMSGPNTNTNSDVAKSKGIYNYLSSQIYARN
jgi:hypothetical protein